MSPKLNNRGSDQTLFEAIEQWKSAAALNDRACLEGWPEDAVQDSASRLDAALRQLYAMQAKTITGLCALAASIVEEQERCGNLEEFFHTPENQGMRQVLSGLLKLIGPMQNYPVTLAIEFIDRTVTEQTASQYTAAPMK